MKKERKDIQISKIQLNEGQLPWLPRNPRQWTRADIDRTATSIREDPDFLEDRPILLVPHEDVYVAFAGNLRHEGCRAARRSKAPCVIYEPESDEDKETIKRRAMKDNGSFGSWDFDELANSWGDLPLTDWGVPAWDPEPQPKEDHKPAKKADLKVEITCTCIEEQIDLYGRLAGEGYNVKIK